MVSALPLNHAPDDFALPAPIDLGAFRRPLEPPSGLGAFALHLHRTTDQDDLRCPAFCNEAVVGS